MARADVDRSVTAVEGARTRLQTILDNLTAGVILFDTQWRIDTVNPGATRILRVPLSAYQGRKLEDIPLLGDFAQAVEQRFELHLASPEAGERVLIVGDSSAAGVGMPPAPVIVATAFSVA